MSDTSAYPIFEHTDAEGQTKKDFTSDQDVRWCPGCGDYSILANVQRVLPGLNIPREKYVFVSGIGCSSRFPYYMDTYGIHSIHGRAPAIATGIKTARPDLAVFVITGDGDGLSIGGNHLMHVLRRNVDVNIILFNNQIYGLTKGQYSPTSQQGLKSKSTPLGSIDYPLNPLRIALAADASFVARSVDVDAKHLQMVLDRAARHRGTSFIEVFQNCPIFNDGVFHYIQDRRERPKTALELIHGEPMRFGPNKEKGIALDGLKPVVVDVEAHGVENLLVHDETSHALSAVLAEMHHPEFPVPVGVIKAVERPTYEAMMHDQLEAAQAGGKRRSVQDLLDSGNTWTVE